MQVSDRVLRWAVRLYLLVFFVYLLFPLGYMMLLAFNDSRIPTHKNFDFTWKWFGEAWNETRMWEAVQNSLLIGVCVVAVSILLGLAGALLLTRIRIQARSLIYAVLVSPILAPGIVLGIATFIFWSQRLSAWTDMPIRASWWTAVLAQSSFIAAYCMLIFMARLQRFDTTLEEAGLDLGASPRQVFWRITAPYLRPAFYSAGALAFLQSFENYTTTYFAIGADQTFTIFIAGKVRQGVTPAVNAVAVVIVVVTILAAVLVEVRRRREAKRAAARRRVAEQADLALAAGVPGATVAGATVVGAGP